MPKDIFEHESLQDNRSLVEYLKALQEGFANGRLTLSDQEKEIVLHPDGLVRLEIGASRKRGRTRVTLRFDWKEETPDVGNGKLRINGEAE